MEIAVISGKGGTGKSSISAAFATLKNHVVLADCDVDAANLYILFNPVVEKEKAFVTGQKAVIDERKCTNCGYCIDFCRFDAISYENDKVIISDTLCDGCVLCSRICPYDAINNIYEDKSRMDAGSFRNGRMVYGRLAPGEENSGKLVNMVRQEAKREAENNQLAVTIIDGPPGIGCPVISAITGVDHVIIVTEPSVSGLHDLKRTIEITSKFNLKSWVIINKSDINSNISELIKTYCKNTRIDILAELPFDSQMVEAMVQCKSIIEWLPDSTISQKLIHAFNRITNGS